MKYARKTYIQISNIMEFFVINDLSLSSKLQTHTILVTMTYIINDDVLTKFTSGSGFFVNSL